MLIYSGHADRAREYVDLAFETYATQARLYAHELEKQAFLIELALQMVGSRYMEGILSLNRAHSIGQLLTGEGSRVCTFKGC